MIILLFGFLKENRFFLVFSIDIVNVVFGTDGISKDVSLMLHVQNWFLFENNLALCD